LFNLECPKMAKRPDHVKPPAYLSESPPVPAPETPPATSEEWGGPKGEEPTRYGDWENKGIAWDF
jgi:hypothetical protein